METAEPRGRFDLDTAPLCAALAGALVAGAGTLAWKGFPESPVALLVALFIGGAGAFALFEGARARRLTPALLFVFGIAYYHVVVPYEYAVDPAWPREFVETFPSFREHHLVGPLVATDIALAAFLIGYLPRRRLDLRAPRPATPAPGATDEARFLLASVFVGTVGAALYLAMSVIATGSITGIFNTTYRERDELFYGLGVFGSGIELFHVGVTCIVVLLIRRGGVIPSVIAIALCALMGLHSFLVGSKMHVFRVGLGALVALSASLGARARRASDRLLVAGVVIALVVPLLFVGLARNKQGEGLHEMASFVADEVDADALNPANIDAWGPYLTLSYTVAKTRVPDDLRFGRTYLDALLILPPRFLYPNRPTPLDEQFAKDFSGREYYDNAGYSFSAIAEAYVNFALPGVALVFLGAGFAFGRIRDALARHEASIAAAALYSTAASWMALAVRGEIGGLIKNYGLLTLVPTLAILLAARVRRPVRA